MRIEQYFLMTDYSLWEVILNGDSPIPTRVIEGVVQPVASTTAEQRLARKNELKARGTLLMALPDKHQLKFNIHKDAKTLMEAIEKRFGGNKETKKVQKTLLKQQYENFIGLSSESLDQIHDRNKTDLEEQSLDDLFNSLKIYEAKVKSSSCASTSTQNIAFVSSQNTDSTNESVSIVASVSSVSAKVPAAALPNVDTLSNAVIYTFFASQSNTPPLDNDDLKQIDDDDLEEMDLKWQMAMKGHFARKCRSPKDTRRNVSAKPQRRNVPVETSTSNALVSQCDGVGSYNWSFQAEEEPTNYALMAFTSSSSSSFDNEVASCSKAYTKDYATLQSYYDKLTNDLRKYQFNVISYKTGLESIEARLLVYQKNETIFEEDIKLLKLDVQLRDNALVVLRQKFEKAEQERDELQLKFFETDESLPVSPKCNRYQSGDGYHDVPLPYTRTFMSPKPDLVFHDAPNVNETVHTAFNVELSPTKPDKHLSPTHRPSAPLIEHWVSDSEDDSEAEPSQNAPSFVQPFAQPKSHGNSRNRKACFVSVLTKSKLVLLTAARPVTTVVPQLHVTRPRSTKTIVTKPHSSPRRYINRRPSPKPSNFPLKVTTIKATMFNAVKGVQGKWDKGVIDSGCSRHMIGNMSYLNDFEKINGGYVTFGGNPKGGKISSKDTKCIVLSPGFKLPDENQVLLRIPRETNMYNVDLKNIVPSGDLTCLFAKATLDESNLWHRRLGHINFKTMNKLGKKHRASYKTKPVSSVSQPLQRFTLVFFLATKDETSPILKTFITGIENQLTLKVKIIRSDNGTEFKNQDLIQLRGMKGIKREFSIPRTPQQNGIAERKNKNLIEAARTMLADSLPPIPFWAEAVNTACVSLKILSRTRKPNGEALRKCILSGPYKPTTILVQVVEATDDSPAVPAHTTVETPMNMSPENKAHFLAEKEAIHLILTGIGNDIYSTVDACQTAQEMWEAIERLQQGQRLISLTTSAGMVKTTTRHKGKEISKPITPLSETASEVDNDPKQAQRDKDMQKNLALIAKYFKKIYKPTNNNIRTSSNSKNKNVDTIPRFKNDNQSGQFRNQRMVNVAVARENVGSKVVRQSGIQCFNCREFGHFAKECRKPKRVKDSAYHKEKMLLCKQAEQGVPLQAEQYDWLAYTDEEVDKQELEAHYSYMAKIQEVPTADSGTVSEPVEQVQNEAGYNVFANHLQHSEQSESISNTCLVETDDSNVIPDSPNMCEDDIQNEQNDVESDDERVALANLIANLKLDVDENKKI
uniref:Uncharacterized protein n=1 Tax=Tanacetum cinerariifolium TaxID=118510 RepID=A0A6L2NM02_TANCI|nr:hypothetical protein [Tanacetum cinerariifolium]